MDRKARTTLKEDQTNQVQLEERPLVWRGPRVPQKDRTRGLGSHPENAMAVEDVLANPRIWKILLVSNIFIIGKIGFFNRICERLIKRFNKRGNSTIHKVRTEEDIIQLRGEEAKFPIFVTPAAKNRESLNHLITLALGLGRPIWLVALPSQIERNLLLSFDCFFLSPGVKLDPLNDLIPLDEADRETLEDNITTPAILFLNQQVAEIGKIESLGTVVYLQIP